MKRNIKFLSILILSLCAFALTSCDNDTVEELPDYMVVEYNYSCSPDLLEFVIPIVSYTDNNGNVVTKDLSGDIFVEENRGTTSITVYFNGVEVVNSSLEHIINLWSMDKKYEGLTAKDTYTFTYRLRDDAPAIDPDRTYRFYHGYAGCKVSVYIAGEHKYTEIKQANVVVNDCKGSEAENYLNLMPSITESDNIDFSATVNQGSPAVDAVRIN